MAGALHSKNIMVRILLGIIVGGLAVGMLLYLVPQGTTTGTAPDTIAEVGDRAITVADIRAELQKIESRSQVPRALEAFYAQRILSELVFEKILELEAQRLGIRVTDEERAERIRQVLPTAYRGDTFVGLDRYAADVQLRFNMGVPEFEELIRKGLLEEKFRRLVTDGISVGPDEVEQEFKRQNEKIKLDYVLIKPEELEPKIALSDAEIAAAYEKNKSRYTVPERRVVRYALLDINQLRRTAQVSEDELRAVYRDRIAQYQVPNRVHAEHILFKSIGKTDAEVEEIRKKAEEVLKKARKGAKFEDLAKQYSEDSTKDKGGDLGWILQGQTVPEFEKAAFSLSKGAVSDLIRVPYGFHIIKVIEHENAHTRPFEEVRGSLQGPLVLEKADRIAADEADRIAAEIRKSTRTPLDDIAKKFNLSVEEIRALSPTNPVLELGNSREIRDAIFRLRPGELSAPIRTDRGYVVLSVKEIQSSHPGALDEVRDRVTPDLRREKAAELARARADELARRAQAGESFQAAAKALGFEAKSSDAISRTGSISGVGSARQFMDAFQLKVGETPRPVELGSNRLVYRVVERQEAKQEDFEKQRKQLEIQVLQAKRSVAYEAFRAALEEKLKQDGKLKLMPEKLKNFGNLG